MPVPPEVLNDDDVFHAAPPLSVSQALARLSLIERRDPNCLNGLAGNALMLEYYAADHGRIWGQEWGAAKTAEIVDPECVIVSGGPGGVDWGALMAADMTPLAHSHPFHRATVGTTRAIGGAVQWTAVNGSGPVQNVGARLKVFPSAGDFRFCAVNNLVDHVVKTPYLWVQNAGLDYVMDPDVAANLAAAPRINFRITKARLTGTTLDSDVKATLSAEVNGAVVWKRDDLVVSGGGGGGLAL